MADRDYWQLSGGISVNEARTFAEAEGFGFDIGRRSRFENARNAVIVGKGDLKGDLVNRLLLAEEIQHGLDWPDREASKALRRGLTNEQFHAELFRRIIDGHRNGRFRFLVAGDLAALEQLIRELQ